MGDTSNKTGALDLEKTQDNSQSKPSIDCLKESKKQPDLSIKSGVVVSEQTPNSTPETTAENPKVSSKLETVFEKLDIDQKESAMDSISESESNDIKKPRVEIPPLEFEIRDNASATPSEKVANETVLPTSADECAVKPLNNKLKEINSLWSVQGSPSVRIKRKIELGSGVFPPGCMGNLMPPPTEKENPSRRFYESSNEINPDLTGQIENIPRKRPTSTNQVRNPLTGEGYGEISKVRNAPRREGNPLLGIGYYDVEDTSSPDITEENRKKFHLR